MLTFLSYVVVFGIGAYVHRRYSGIIEGWWHEVW